MNHSPQHLVFADALLSAISVRQRVSNNRVKQRQTAGNCSPTLLPESFNRVKVNSDSDKHSQTFSQGVFSRSAL
jgi:hypothetical protein